MMRQAKNNSVHERINVVQHGDVALRMLPLKIALGIFHATFEWGEHGRFFRALHRAVSIHDAPRNCSVSPDGHVVCSVKGIAAGMVEVIVGIEGSFYGRLTHCAESLHLEGCSRRADKSLKQKSAVLSGKEAAVTQIGR